MNDLGLQFFSSDQAFAYGELGGEVSLIQAGIAQGRSERSQRLEEGAGVRCCNSHGYICRDREHILCKCHKRRSIRVYKLIKGSLSIKMSNDILGCTRQIIPQRNMGH